MDLLDVFKHNKTNGHQKNVSRVNNPDRIFCNSCHIYLKRKNGFEHRKRKTPKKNLRKPKTLEQTFNSHLTELRKVFETQIASFSPNHKIHQQ